MATRVVVTGAAGRIGHGIASRLAAAGRLHAALDIADGPMVSHVVDLADPVAATPVLREAVAGADALIHVAAHPGPAATEPAGVPAGWGAATVAAGTIGLEQISPQKLLLDNLGSSMSVFEAAAHAGIARVVFSSTAFAMGWCHDPTAMAPATLPLSDANYPGAPYETYGLSKQCCEAAAAMLARATEGRTGFVSLRFTNIVKRELYPHSLPWPAPPDPPPYTPAEVSADRPAFPIPFWAWAHEDDVIEAHMLAADADAARLFAGEPEHATTFLIAAPSTRFAEPTEGLLTSHLGPDRAGAIDRPNGPLVGNASVLSSARATEVLGWHPRCWTTEGAK